MAPVNLPMPRVGAATDLAPQPIRVVLNWGRRYSLWVFNFGLACCAIEFIAASMARHDFIRLGVIPFAPGPRQADLMVVSGTVTDKMAPAMRRLYDQMPEPKYVISVRRVLQLRRALLGLLQRHQRRRHDHPRRRLRARLPAAARVAPAGHPQAAGEDRRADVVHQGDPCEVCGSPHRLRRRGDAGARRPSDWHTCRGAVVNDPAAVQRREVPPQDWVASVEAARGEGFTFFDWLTAVDQTDAAETPGSRRRLPPHGRVDAEVVAAPHDADPCPRR